MPQKIPHSGQMPLKSEKNQDLTVSLEIGPSGFIVDSLEFSAKENHRARQRTLPTDSRAFVALGRGRCAA